MRAIIQSLHRDHREIEEVLRALQQECDRFQRAERPDYELISEIIDYLRPFLDQHHNPEEDLLLNVLARTQSATCASILDKVAGERAAAALSLQELGAALGEIINEQRVLRQAFDDAARSFMQHERQRIETEEQQLFPEALALLTPADWAEIHTKLRDEKTSPPAHRLEERLRAKHGWIVQEALADQTERSRLERPSTNEAAPIGIAE